VSWLGYGDGVVKKKMQPGVTGWVAGGGWHGWEHGLSWLVYGQSKFFIRGSTRTRE